MRALASVHLLIATTGETVEPLVRRYLGTLPSTGGGESWRDPGIRPPVGVVEKVIRRGLEPRSRTQIVFSGEGRDFAEILKYERLIDALDAEAVQEAARAWLRPDNYLRVSLFPADEDR